MGGGRERRRIKKGLSVKEHAFYIPPELGAAPALLTHPGIDRQDLGILIGELTQDGAHHVRLGPAVTA